MISAGNDIVAFSKVNKHNTNQFAYYSKILSASEQTFYHSSPLSGLPFEHYVWLLWSVKESVYKFLKRIRPELTFSPTKIIVNHFKSCEDGPVVSNQQKCFKGMVSYEQATLFFTSKISADWIASVVNDIDDFDNICWQIERIEDETYHHQSNLARQLLLEKLDTLIPGDLTIEKNPAGYPEIIKNNQKIDIPASIAHHGFFVSYAFNLTHFTQN